MKTLFLFDGGEGELYFFETEGDHRRFDDIYINAELDEENNPGGMTKEGFEALQAELSELVYDDEGDFAPEALPAPTKDWDYFVRCGFIP